MTTIARRLVLSAALWATACGVTRAAPAARAGSTPRPAGSGEVSTLEEVPVALSGRPAARFGEAPRHSLLPGEESLVGVLETAGLVHSLALSRAARELARTTPDSRHVPGDLVDAVMSWSGLVDPRPRLTLLELGDPGHRCAEGAGPTVTASCAEVLRTIAEGVARWLPGGPARVGVGMVPLGPSQTRVLVAVSEVGVVLDPIPTSAARGEALLIRGRLQGARRDPQVVVVDAEGRSRDLPVTVAAERSFSATARCEAGSGPSLQVEVLAAGAHGPEVVANFRVACGGPPPSRVTIVLERLVEGATLDDVVRASYEALNDERRRAGLEPLAWSAAAAEVARLHSEDMVRAGFIGHRSPTTGTARDRFRRGGVPAAALRENIARGYGPFGIHQGLMNSPGHRSNLLSEDVTHVGIGAAWDSEPDLEPGARRPIVLTQNFFSELGADAPDDPSATLRERVDASRTGAGLRPIRWDAELAAAARTLALGVARADESSARRRYEAALRATPFREVETRLVVAGSFARLLEHELWSGPLDGSVGVAIARVESGETEGALAMVVAVGRR